MRNTVILLVCMMLTIFLLPAMLTKSFISNIGNEPENENENPNETENANPSGNENTNQTKHTYSKYNTIKLLHKSSNEIEELYLDDYILGVVSAEMPASYEQEALKAQAVVARTYTIYTIEHNQNKHEGADICDSSSCCQAWISKDDRLSKWEEAKREEYWSKIEKSVNETTGKIITYNGEVIDAFFHSNSGGKTEEPVNVWGGTNYPYLQVVETAGEDAYSQYSSEIIISKQELENKIREKHSNFEIDYSQEDAIKIIEYTASNRVKTIKIGNLNLSGVEVRTIIGLKSANFSVSIEGENIKFEVKGYGHGVGMSQTGADSMAKEGSTYEEIIKHFYSNVEIEEM